MSNHEELTRRVYFIEKHLKGLIHFIHAGEDTSKAKLIAGMIHDEAQTALEKFGHKLPLEVAIEEAKNVDQSS